jgi:membrane protease YdiL (CAAX protease family)
VLGLAVGPALAVSFLPRFPGLSPEAALFAGLAVKTALLAIPAILAPAVLGRSARELGLTWGAPRTWAPWLLGLLAAALPLAVLLSRLPDVQAAYPVLRAARLNPWWLLPSTAAFALYGLAWEFFFRGFLLWGLAPRLGWLAILAQAIPCALMHVGKPAVELAASLPFALLLGMLAYRSRSVLPGWLLHTAVSLTINLACVVWA